MSDICSRFLVHSNGLYPAHLHIYCILLQHEARLFLPTQVCTTIHAYVSSVSVIMLPCELVSDVQPRVFILFGGLKHCQTGTQQTQSRPQT